MNGKLVCAAALLLTAAIGCSKPSGGAPAGSSAAPAPAAAHPLDVGDAAPDLGLTLQSGKTLALSSLRGKVVAVYFYPKDDTPGCRVEAQGIRDHWEDLQKAGITVIGVSEQDAASHRQFIDKERLPFDLAVDTNGEIARAFGVPVRLGFAARQTFLIGRDGRVKKVWREVTPSGHAEEILAAAAGS